MAAILTDAGIGNPADAVYAQDNIEGIIFGGAGPMGGCVVGTVTATELEMDVRGYIKDGGCTALSGH